MKASVMRYQVGFVKNTENSQNRIDRQNRLTMIRPTSGN